VIRTQYVGESLRLITSLSSKELDNTIKGSHRGLHLVQSVYLAELCLVLKKAVEEPCPLALEKCGDVSGGLESLHHVVIGERKYAFKVLIYPNIIYKAPFNPFEVFVDFVGLKLGKNGVFYPQSMENGSHPSNGTRDVAQIARRGGLVDATPESIRDLAESAMLLSQGARRAIEMKREAANGAAPDVPVTATAAED
jgi:hypothetical protein